MRKPLSFLSCVMLAVVSVGCTTTSIVNLTPSQQPRNEAGLYPVEALWKSNRKSIREETLSPFVVVGLETYPMRPAPLVTNRWETLVPIPADQNELYYYFKFDYKWQAFPESRPDSTKSEEYRMEIID